METLLERLSVKDDLDVGDVSDLLRFLQNETEPLLSHHTSSPATTTRRTTGINNRSSPLAADLELVNTRSVGSVATGSVPTRPHTHSISAKSTMLDDSYINRGEIFHNLINICVCIHMCIEPGFQCIKLIVL